MSISGAKCAKIDAIGHAVNALARFGRQMRRRFAASNGETSSVAPKVRRRLAFQRQKRARLAAIDPRRGPADDAGILPPFVRNPHRPYRGSRAAGSKSRAGQQIGRHRRAEQHHAVDMLVRSVFGDPSAQPRAREIGCRQRDRRAQGRSTSVLRQLRGSAARS